MVILSFLVGAVGIFALPVNPVAGAVLGMAGFCGVVMFGDK